MGHPAQHQPKESPTLHASGRRGVMNALGTPLTSLPCISFLNFFSSLAQGHAHGRKRKHRTDPRMSKQTTPAHRSRGEELCSHLLDVQGQHAET